MERRSESDSWARDLSDVSLHITIMVLGETERNREPPEQCWGNVNFVMEANFSTIGSKMGLLHVGASHKTRLVGMGLGRQRCAE